MGHQGSTPTIHCLKIRYRHPLPHIYLHYNVWCLKTVSEVLELRLRQIRF